MAKVFIIIKKGKLEENRDGQKAEELVTPAKAHFMNMMDLSGQPKSEENKKVTGKIRSIPIRKKYTSFKNCLLNVLFR